MFHNWVLFSLLSLKLFASGAWYQDMSQVSIPKKAIFNPQFLVLKAGVFSKTGHFTVAKALNKLKLKNEGSRNLESIAWVTHRLSPGETLSKEAGEILGIELSKKLLGTYFTSIELDIEPLTKAESWLEPFLKGIRKNLSSSFKLRLAVPVLSPKTVSGHFWSLQDGAQAINWVDGLDVMVYDSGLKSQKEYSELFKNVFFFVMELVKQSPEKNIILGLPTYDDRTRLHDKEYENLETVLTTLKPFTPFQLKYYCSGQIRFAYYAGWTLSQKDQSQHQQLEEWTNEICKKSL